MFTIIIQEKGGEQRRMVFNKPEVTIGRVQGNDIVLPKGNVSKRHARIVLKDGKFIIVDLKSTNGTYVNGRKITSPLVVKDSDKIYIGDFIVGVDEAAANDAPIADQSETTTAPPGANDRLMPAGNAPDVRPPRPTEAQPMAMPPQMGQMSGNMGMPPPMGAGSGPMGMPPPEPPPPAPPPQITRPGPPRPMPPGPSREPLGQPREVPPPRDMPPISGPPPGPRPGGPRPGGTMPPPIAPIPPPMAPPPAPTSIEPHNMGMGAPSGPMGAPPLGHGSPNMAPPAPAPFPVPQPAPTPAPIAASGGGGGAAVVPLPSDKGNHQAKRNLVGAGAKKVVGRSMSSMPSRRGLTLEPLDPKVVKMLDLQSSILERLKAKLDLDKIAMDQLHNEDLWQRAERATVDLVETLDSSGELPKYIDQDTLIKETLNEALALGPLEDLLADDKVDEIVIDRRDRVVVGKDGQMRGSGKAFSSDDVFERVVKRLVAEAGGHIDENEPLVDLRMRDGTRLTAAVSPVAARGACIVLKKPSAQSQQLSDLVASNALSSGMADFLATAIAARRNILVCGGPNSGKTTVVSAIASGSPAGERIVSIEEVAELAMMRDEWIQLEARASNGKHAAIDLGNLLDTAMRLAPDRLVIGEVRGREALSLISALNSSVDGAVVAMTGEGGNAALSRLATLARMSAGASGDSAVRDLVASAFEIIVHVVRFPDGSVRVHSIEEIAGYSDHAFDTHVLFQHKDGSFAATGTVPRFYAELEARGIPADQAVFR